MLSRSFTLQVLLITLLSICVGSLAGPCMPCQASNRRDTPWDRLSPSRRGVYNPKITNPTNNTVWITGSDVIVTWDVRDMPDKTSNSKATLLLGYLENGSEDEHLNNEMSLASDIDMKKGFVTFKCPEVKPRKYIVVLFGDSANRSPEFSIKKSE